MPGQESSTLITLQKRIYGSSWDKYGWQGERLYPVVLPLEDILKGSTAKLHTPSPPNNFNVLGTPRCGTKWMVKIMALLLRQKTDTILFSLRKKIQPSFSGRYEVRHYHEGIIDDFKPEQKVVFIYRDIRDAIVSGYFYLKNGNHSGTMDCTPETYSILSREQGIEKQLIMYMKYRMPVMNYWLNTKADNVVKVKYEDLLQDREKWIRHINDKCGINAGEKIVRATVEETSFRTMSGRSHGVEDATSHQRKGIKGDWNNHFTEKHIRIFREMGGEEFLMSAGYDL